MANEIRDLILHRLENNIESRREQLDVVIFVESCLHICEIRITFSLCRQFPVIYGFRYSSGASGVSSSNHHFNYQTVIMRHEHSAGCTISHSAWRREIETSGTDNSKEPVRFSVFDRSRSIETSSPGCV